jgi:(S)-mandelate dehydrogenase
LPRFAFDYLEGGAGDESCLRRNRRALDAAVLVPRVLNDVSHVRLERSFFGEASSNPLIIAPLGLTGLLWPNGDIANARAAAAHGSVFTLSTASTSPIDAVSAATHGAKWFQLYVFGSRTVAASLMSKAEAAGFKVLVLTVDTPVNGNRLRDARNGFSMPLRYSPRLLLDVLRHPGWLARLLFTGMPKLRNVETEDEHATAEVQAALLTRSMDRSLTWRSLEWIRSCWRGPIVLKGVLHPDDAVLAKHCGIDGVIVSNHGGRQLDAAPATLDVLPNIVDSAGDQLKVFVDGGFNSGADVVKALALGAHGVMIGRPILYGLAAAGERGASAVLRALIEDVARTCALMGINDIDRLTRAYVTTPVAARTLSGHYRERDRVADGACKCTIRHTTEDLSV